MSITTLIPTNMRINTTETMAENSLMPVMRLLEFTDSAFPVGAFSFSNGLETAAGTGEVAGADGLREFARDVLRRSAATDCVAALCAFRCSGSNDYEGVVEADEQLWLSKLNTEARQMTVRMGRRAAELADRILGGDDGWQRMGPRWLGDICAGRVRGTHPVTLAMVFAICGLSERDLFCSLCYGALNTVLSAALRCVRVSHYDTQRILFELSGETDALFDAAADAGLEDMCSFAPQTEIFASLHEKGSSRMFMN